MTDSEERELAKRLSALSPGEPASKVNGCSCDFCTGKKRHEDNWCARCAKVQMQPPKWWENLDVCDECEQELRTNPDPVFSP